MTVYNDEETSTAAGFHETTKIDNKTSDNKAIKENKFFITFHRVPSVRRISTKPVEIFIHSHTHRMKCTNKCCYYES